MSYLKGRVVHLWYRYPSEPFPRSVRARVIDPSVSIADAVSLSIARDTGNEEVLASSTPTLELMRQLQREPNMEVEYALAYTCVQPPSFFQKERRGRKRTREDEVHPHSQVRKRRKRGGAYQNCASDCAASEEGALFV